MIHYSYSKKEYKEKQSLITKGNWRKGIFNFIYKKEKRDCAREGCSATFEVTPSDPKMYCSSNCAAIVNNAKRSPMSTEQKAKISVKLKGRRNPNAGVIKVPRVEIICANLKCKKVFLVERWMKRKYCSNVCAMAVTGAKPTSPKASRGKAGIRNDISSTIYFHSRWEANYARLMNYLGIEWEYEPKTFDLGSQNYTPDFYLTATKEYIEIKNFLWRYSKVRDEKFRELYPEITLKMVLKGDYLKLQSKYAKLIKNWEYSNSPFSY